MFRKCCVNQCKSTRQDVKLHRLPSRDESKNRWLQCLGYKNLQTLEQADICKLHVCHKHFEDRFVLSTNRLKSDAYPSLFTETEISTGRPALIPTSTATIDLLPLDHNYCMKGHLDHPYNKQYTTTDVGMVPDCTSTNITINMMPSTSGFSSEHESTNESETLKTPQKSKNRKIVRDAKSLTPECRLLYREFIKARRQRDYKSRVNRALKFTKKQTFEELCKNMNPMAKKLMWMQVKLCTKNKRARRFTMDEKLIGLSVYKQSTEAYKFLQKIFILPSKTTLKKIISELNIEAGINTQFLSLIKQQVEK